MEEKTEAERGLKSQLQSREPKVVNFSQFQRSCCSLSRKVGVAKRQFPEKPGPVRKTEHLKNGKSLEKKTWRLTETHCLVSSVFGVGRNPLVWVTAKSARVVSPAVPSGEALGRK